METGVFDGHLPPVVEQAPKRLDATIEHAATSPELAAWLLARRPSRETSEQLSGLHKRHPHLREIIASLPEIAAGYHDDYEHLASINPETHRLEVDYNPWQLTTTVAARVDTLRKLDRDFVAVLNPRTWSVTANSFWPEAFLVSTREGRFDFNAPKCEVCRNPEAGWKGVFFEHLQVNWLGWSIAAYENFLNMEFGVTTEPPFKQVLSSEEAKKYEATKQVHCAFDLYACRDSRVGIQAMRGGIDIDQGGLLATEISDKSGKFAFTRVISTKTLRYSDRAPNRADEPALDMMGQGSNYLAPAILGKWFDLMVVKGVSAKYP